VQRYQDRLYGFVMTLIGNHADAEEIAQDSFVSAYRALQGYETARRSALALRPWLFTIALNKVRNRSRRAAPAALDDGMPLAVPACEGPEARAEAREAIAVLRTALENLAPRYRMPVVLRHIQGLSYDEIANVLQQPVGTAKANVHRGLALLRCSGKVAALV